MTVTFLGTGTSQGVPVIGCDCEVCLSEDTRDQRLRTAALIEKDGKKVVIDVGPDFRQQMLRAAVTEIDAVLITHEHNDHIIGMDDVRPINFRQGRPMPVYAKPSVQKTLKERFAYVFADNPYPGAPRIFLRDIRKDQPVIVDGWEFIPVQLWHGRLPVYGFRTGDFTYLTDLNKVDEAELEKVKGTRFLALDALHHTRHHSHFNLEEALEFVQLVQPEQTYLIHISHRMGKAAEINSTLPTNVQLAYDGLVWEVS